MCHAYSWLLLTVQQVHGSGETLGCANVLIGLSSDPRSIINGSSSILWTQLLSIPGCSTETTAMV